jgi:two-component system LytT family response regulator
MLRALIVDDEELARRGLQIRLQSIEDIEVCGESCNGREALAHVAKFEPDLLFLDIQMPGMSGFEVLQALAGTQMPSIVFVTAYDRFALQAFEANAVDYLLKPISEDRLRQAVAKVRIAHAQRAARQQQPQLLRLICSLSGTEVSLEQALADAPLEGRGYASRLVLREDRETRYVDTSSIRSIEVAGDYLCVSTAATNHVLRGTLKAFLRRIDPLRFVQVHRSLVVNRGFVMALRPHRNGEYFVRLAGGREFRTGRTFRTEVEGLG